jgi:hypothetical protein
MSIILVTYDLKQPGRNYQPVYDFLKRFTYCKGMESVWLLDTTQSCESIRDGLKAVVDGNDIVFAVRLQREWNSWNYTCADWLNKSERNW